jgi:hypothetical protein
MLICNWYIQGLTSSEYTLLARARATNPSTATVVFL